jgi:RNA polymerase sigma factor (sigma-70 family)
MPRTTVTSIASKRKLEDFIRGLIEDHGKIVFAVISAREANRQDAEDLWAEVFDLAFRHHKKLMGVSPEGQQGWLVQTAKFLVANHSRRSITRRRTIAKISTDPILNRSDIDDPSLTSINAMNDARVRLLFQEAMAALPPEQRQLLAWDALGENSSVIGQRLGINASTVRSRLASARAALKSEVERLMPSDNSPTQPTTEQLGGDA